MTALQTLRDRLSAGEVVVIDGGMGPELTRRGVPMHPVAWAAPAVLDHYDTVREAHEDYISAGAEVLIVNTFMASHNALRAAGMIDRVDEINRRSVQAAIEARENLGAGNVLIAGAMFPGHANDQEDVLEKDRTGDAQALDSDVHEQAEILASAGADLIALEMIQTTQWGRLATNAVTEVGLPVWLGVSQGRIEWEGAPDFVMPYDPPGDAGLQVKLILEQTPNADIMAVNVMHTEIGDVAETLDGIEPHWSGVLGAYPHFGEHTAEPPGFVSLPIDPVVYAAHAREWVDRGVQIIGGCCGIGPEHIKVLKEELPRRVGQAA